MKRTALAALAAMACILGPTSRADAQASPDGLKSVLIQTPKPETENGSGGGSGSDAVSADRSVGRSPGYLGLVADGRQTGRGVRVLSIQKSGPSGKAGILPGDLIVSIDGRPINDLSGLTGALRNRSAGDRVVVQIERGYRRQTFGVVLGPQAGSDQPSDSSRAAAATSEDRAVLGVKVVELTPELRRQYRITTLRGALIKSIQPGSPADVYGLPLFGVIVSAGGRSIRGPDDLTRLLSAARPGQAVDFLYVQGGRHYGKTIRLAPAAPPAVSKSDASTLPQETVPSAPPKVTVPAPPPADSDSRPADAASLRQLEESLAEKDLTAPADEPADDANNEEAIREELQSLRAQVKQLLTRIAELEGQLGASDKKSP